MISVFLHPDACLYSEISIIYKKLCIFISIIDISSFSHGLRVNKLCFVGSPVT